MRRTWAWVWVCECEVTGDGSTGPGLAFFCWQTTSRDVPRASFSPPAWCYDTYPYEYRSNVDCDWTLAVARVVLRVPSSVEKCALVVDDLVADI